MKTPVTLLIFNRLQTTEKVFNSIREVQPSKLLVIADGPRLNYPGEVKKCEAVRKIIDKVDWNCEVLTNYSETNLGCKLRVSSGLDWVFKQVEESIILEDDCLPHPTFFPFCEELLDRYRDDQRVMIISGNNFQATPYLTEYSYYFSRYPLIWGWATWRRAWQYYDIEMNLWQKIRDEGWLNSILQNRKDLNYWTKTFEKTYNNEINTWDYQWTFACWLQNGLSLLPHINLVTNIGFDKEGTHTANSSHPFANFPVHSMNFPLSHPPFIIRHNQTDCSLQNSLFNPNLKSRIQFRLGRVLNRKKNLSTLEN